MATGYSRQSAGTILTGNTIQASDFNAEYNLLETAFSVASGHNHDGTIGGGAPLVLGSFASLTSSSSGILVADGANGFLTRTLIAPANGITVTNGNGVAGNPTLALAQDLLALESLAGTGIGVRTATNTWAQRSIAAGANISVTNGDGVSGNPTIAVTGIGSTIQGYDATLAALAAYNTNGILTQTAADTFTGRTITGTAGTITVTNGSGVAGNPTLTIDSSYIGQNTITTLGTITTGVWSGTTVGISKGGTGQTTANAAFNALAPSQATNSGKFLTTDGTDTSWATITPDLGDPGANGLVTRTALNTTTARTIVAGANISVTNGSGVAGNPAIGFSGTLPVANGGTGATTLTANNVILGNGTSAPSFVAPGSSGNVLTSNGTTWTSAAAPNLVKAWAYFNGTTLIAGTAGVSISKASTGNYIVTIPAQPNANYAKLVMGGGSADVTCWAVDFSTAAVYTAPTTTSFYFSSKDAGNTARDYDYCSIIVVGA